MPVHACKSCKTGEDGRRGGGGLWGGEYHLDKARKWSAGAWKGRSVRLPGRRPARSELQYRSTPDHISGSTSVRFSVCAIAHALRTCKAVSSRHDMIIIIISS